MSDVFAPQPVKTKVAGDVVVNINSGQTVGLVAGSAIVGTVRIDQTTPGTTNGVQFSGSLPAGTNVIGKTGIDQTTPGTTNGVQVIAALPVGANVVGKVGIDQTTPGTTNAVQVIGALPVLSAGTNVIGALTANQSTNTAQVGGVAVAVGSGASNAGTQRMILSTDQATLAVSQGLLYTTYDSGVLTSANLAAGVGVALNGSNVPAGSTGKLYELTCSSSVATKVQLGTYSGTTFVAKRVFFVPANTSFSYAPSRYDAITQTGGAVNSFQAIITNMDNANAADVFASITTAY